MQLTRFTDYALRTLTFLAIQPGDRLSTITEVADTFAISRNHVVKIVHQLGIKGYIETVRGRYSCAMWSALLFELFPHYNTLCRFVQYTVTSPPLLLQICNQ